MAAITLGEGLEVTSKVASLTVGGLIRSFGRDAGLLQLGYSALGCLSEEQEMTVQQAMQHAYTFS